jgi:hypothetical protein
MSQALTVSSLMPLIRWIAAREFRSGEHGEAFNDCLLVIFLAVEDRSLGSGYDLLASGALPLLTAFARETEFTQISGVYASIVRAFLIPAKRIGRCAFIIFEYFVGAHGAENYRSTQIRVDYLT